MEKRSSLFGRLLRDQRGVVALTFAVTFSVMLGSSLMALDFVRYNVAQARIQNALDTAVISAGRKLANYQSTGPGYDPGQAWRDDATAYFKANVPTKFLGVTIPDGALTIRYEEDRVDAGGATSDTGKFLSAQRISMSVTGTLPLMSTGFVKETGLSIQAQNWALRRVRDDLELVLALDNTGSMDTPASSGWGSPTRMDLLKQSANSLIETVMAAAAAGGQTDGTSGAYIGLVPFTDSVNVGGIPTAKGWLDVRPEQQNYVNNLWTGCIIEPGPTGGDWSATNPLPASVLSPGAKFKPMLSVYGYRYSQANFSSGAYPNYDFIPLASDGSIPAGDVFRFWPPSSAGNDRRIAAQVYTNDSSLNGKTKTSYIDITLAQESTYCTVSKTLFLTKDQATLQDSVLAMKPYGGTGIPAGLIWAWRMLSPQWRGSAGWGDPSLPRDPDSKLRKVIVLLSDGANEPVVTRASVSQGKAERFQLSYDYQECQGVQTTGSGSKKTTSCTSYKKKPIDKKPVSFSLPSFSQCPITGLRSVDPSVITADNYDNSCDSTTANSSTIGYSRGQSESGRGNLTSTAEDSYMADLCTNIKADRNNITIYTLTLGSDVTSTAKGVMRGCASDPDKTYFDVSNAADLPDVFAQIAGALTELRLTEDPGTSSGS